MDVILVFALAPGGCPRGTSGGSGAFVLGDDYGADVVDWGADFVGEGALVLAGLVSDFVLFGASTSRMASLTLANRTSWTCALRRFRWPPGRPGDAD